MFDLWKEPLTEEERETLLDKAAHEIKKRKMETPAILALEMHKPLAFLGSQAVVAFSPFLVPTSAVYSGTTSVGSKTL